MAVTVGSYIAALVENAGVASVKVGNTAPFVIGATVRVTGTDLPSVEVRIADIEEDGTLSLGEIGQVTGKLNLTPYTLAKGAKIVMAAQLVANASATDFGPGPSDYMTSNGQEITVHTGVRIKGNIVAEGNLVGALSNGPGSPVTLKNLDGTNSIVWNPAGVGISEYSIAGATSIAKMALSGADLSFGNKTLGKLSFLTNNVERMYIDGSTGALVSNTATGSNAFQMTTGARLKIGGGTNDYLYSDGANLFTPAWLTVAALASSTGNSLTLRGMAADGATAIGVKITNYNALSTTGAKIVSFYSDNGSTERSYIDKDGRFVGLVDGTFRARNDGDSLTLTGRTTDNGTAVSVIVDTARSYTTTGSKLLSIRNLGTEKAYFTKDGDLAAGQIYAGGGNGTGSFWGSTFGPLTTNTTGSFFGKAVDGASAIGVKIYNANALSTSGAKIASFYSDNGVTERCYIDKDGALTKNQPHDLPFFFPGTRVNSELMARYVFTRAVTFPAAFAGSQYSNETNATLQTVLTLTFVRAGVTQATGTITIATNGTATFALASPYTTQAGDVLKITNQATADATLADISITLAGTR